MPLLRYAPLAAFHYAARYVHAFARFDMPRLRVMILIRFDAAADFRRLPPNMLHGMP